MKKRLLLLITLILLIALPSATVFASDLSAAQYYGVITISNNSTATANVSAVLTLSSADLISQGWVDSDFDNCAIRNAAGGDVRFGPSVNASYPWCLWVPSIGANTNINYTLYTGNDSLSSTKYWFPNDDGMSVDDDATLELDNYFTITWAGLLDTTAGPGKYFLDKTNSNNTSGICFYPSPTVNGTITANIIYFSAASSYVNESRDSSEEVRSGYVIRAGQRFNSFSGNITSVQFSLMKSNSPTGTAYARVRAVSDDSLLGTLGQIDVSTIAAGSFNWYTFNAAAVFVEETQDIRVQFEYDGGDATNRPYIGFQNADVLTGVYTHYTDPGHEYYDVGACDCTIRFYYTPFTVLSVSATGVSSGNILTLSANTTDFWIDIDGNTENSTALSGGAVPDIDDDYTFCSGGCMPYVECVSVNVSGVNKGYWEWEYSTTFTDQSGNGNTATPTFRTASSDPDVSCTLVSFQPIQTALAPAYTVEEAPDFITANITVSGNFTGATVPAGGPPGASLVEGVADAGGTPRIWLWGILAGVAISSAGLFVSYMERKHGGGGGTLLLRIGIGAAVFGVMIAFGKFDWWMLVLYLFIVLAPAMASRHGEWGGSVGQLNLIGFLAMSWVGLTMINRILEGQFIQSAETSFLNTLMFTQEFQLFGIFKVPVMNFQFFTQGIPMLLKWDYSFFGGNAQIFQYLLYSLTAVMSFIVFGFIIGLLYNYFSRLR